MAKKFEGKKLLLERTFSCLNEKETGSIKIRKDKHSELIIKIENEKGYIDVLISDLSKEYVRAIYHAKNGVYRYKLTVGKEYDLTFSCFLFKGTVEVYL